MFYLNIESISRFLLIASIAVSLRGGLTPNQLESAVSRHFGSLACQVCTGFGRYNAGRANVPFQAPRDPVPYALSMWS
jgi:hypothetical protein